MTKHTPKTSLQWTASQRVQDGMNAPHKPKHRHTRGPWSCERKAHSRHDDIMIFAEHDDTFVAEAVGREIESREEIEANAKLIAAAPDLLAILERIRVISSCTNPNDKDESANGFDVIFSLARDGIAKAANDNEPPQQRRKMGGSHV